MDDSSNKSPSEPRKLGPSNRDRLLAISEGIVGLTPCAGPILAKILTEIVPNQRFARLELYVKEVRSELEKIESRLNEISLESEENTILFEDGANQAAQSIDPLRQKYIARIVVFGISAVDSEKANERKILQILGDMTDYEIQILNAHIDRNQRPKLRELAPMPPNSCSTQKELDLHAIYTASKLKLEQLGLLDFHISMKPKAEIPQFDRKGKPKGRYYVTSLGEMLLSRIGFFEQ